MGEIKRKLNEEQLARHQEKIDIYERVLKQKQTDKNKIYSLHAVETACIARRKSTSEI